MNSPICAVLIYVPDVPAALDWYQSAFRGSERRLVSEFDFTCLDFNGISLEIVPSDEKLSIGQWKISPQRWRICLLSERRCIAGRAISKTASRCAWCAIHGETASGCVDSEYAVGAGVHRVKICKRALLD
jgi:hypothetical protein